ncbi:M12 family metallo-peptidase [Nocardioides sp. C4-1]|uniref:M12 family metallo-peptidase n=1 Tax=Nocardioides sp. C4-1 TaxID=3151851 RepID=UPI003267B1EB
MRSLLVPALTWGLVATGLSVLPVATAQDAPAPDAAGAEAAPQVWTPIDALPARRGAQRRRVAPTDHAAYRLDLSRLQSRLAQAPAETSSSAPVVVAVPAPSGELVEFAVTESPVMQAGLAADFPEISTWAGRTTSGEPASIRLDVTPMGFHASVHGAGASWYVDPAYNGLDQGASAPYVSYLADDLPARMSPLVEPDEVDGATPALPPVARRVGEGPGAVAIQRTYRLALVTDDTYAAHFTSSTDPAVVNAVVTAEKVTLVNRVNHIYGNDLSIRLLLVDDTVETNLNTPAAMYGPNGPCGAVACYTTAMVSAGCGSDLLDRNRLVVGQLVGAESYDVGHIGLGLNGGGLAGLGVVGTYDKAAGCTGISVPDGDLYAVDYVAHELGHQFSGNHTFNGTTTNCSGGNRNASTSVEPGSGSSVMAYAGICGSDNLQNHSDPYFSQRSQAEVAAFTRQSPDDDNEVQDVAVSGFSGTMTISYGGAPVTVGSYTAAGVEAAVEAAEPSSATATVTGYWGLSSALTNGFQVAWSGTADIATPAVTVSTGSAVVGTTDNGGVEDMGGFANPAPTGNHNPVVTAPAAKAVPIRTPFTLTGSATDPDGDPLVYSWEQNDTGATLGTGLNSNTKPSGPLFRILGSYADVTAAGAVQYDSPGQNRMGTSPSRSFPDVAQVAAGETNAATGSCPTLSGTGVADSAALRCFSEFLPTTARTMRFRLTARDLSGADGGTSFADVALTVAGTTPFQVTSQGAATAVTGGTVGSVTWNVGSTSIAPISTANVRVSLSTDGGLTFPTVLAASTPNTGSAPVTWPNVATTQGRLKVEAVGNYFYDVNDAAITITPSPPTLTTGGTAAGQDFTAASSDELSSEATISAKSNTVAGSAITMTASGLPGGLALVNTDTTASGATFTVEGKADVDPGSYPVTVTVSDGPGNASDQTVVFTVTVVADDATLTYTGPTASRGGEVTVSSTVVDGDASPGAVAGTVTFGDQVAAQTLCTATVVAGAASCTFTAPASRTYEVTATLTSPRYRGTTSEPAALVVTVAPPSDLTPPQTRITAGPAPGSIQLGNAVTLRFAAEPGARFVCRLRGRTTRCDDGGLSVTAPAAGTYDFQVWAYDAAGNVDTTPATRRFYVPVRDRALTVARGPWRRRTAATTYRGTYTAVARRGAELRYRVRGATSLALVLSNGRGFGVVDVYLGQRRIGRVSGDGPARARRVAALTSFARPTSGVVRIVTRDARQVRIEGLAVRTQAVSPRVDVRATGTTR